MTNAQPIVCLPQVCAIMDLEISADIHMENEYVNQELDSQAFSLTNKAFGKQHWHDVQQNGIMW